MSNHICIYMYTWNMIYKEYIYIYIYAYIHIYMKSAVRSHHEQSTDCICVYMYAYIYMCVYMHAYIDAPHLSNVLLHWYIHACMHYFTQYIHRSDTYFAHTHAVLIHASQTSTTWPQCCLSVFMHPKHLPPDLSAVCLSYHLRHQFMHYRYTCQVCCKDLHIKCT